MTAGMSRRDFVSSVAAAGGNAYAAMLALDLLHAGKPAAFVPAPSANGTKVIILGAGVAGLCAAYELGKIGFDCRILEARMRPGGRVWTARAGTSETEIDGVSQTATFAPGLFFNPGPARVPQHHVTLDYYREFGIAIEPFINVNLNAYYYSSKPGVPVANPRASSAERHPRTSLGVAGEGRLARRARSADDAGRQRQALDVSASTRRSR